jgi:Fe-S-cluster containining protein
MNRQSPFSYQCNQCGRCCHNQVITLSPVDVIAIARATRLTTGAAVARFTMRRGSLLRFDINGGCVARDGLRCTIHRGRPLACRLYPLGLERDGTFERFIRLEPASGSLGIYGDTATVSEFLSGQGVDDLLLLNERYRPLIATMRDRVADMIDFDVVEPNEFWKCAVAEALRETNFDANPIIDALFDADSVGCYRDSIAATVDAHLAVLCAMALREPNPATLAVAAVMLAISLGYSPAEAISSGES